MLWENLREEEFDAAVEEAKGVCVLPIGCVEAHGQHLPLGCDVFQAREYARLGAEKEPVVVFPVMYFGEKSGAGEFRGTIIFPETLIHEILLQSCKEIARNGFKKILVLNGHGGNSAMLQNFARSILQHKYNFTVTIGSLGIPYPKYILPELEKYPYLTEEDIEIMKGAEGTASGHGCFGETGSLYGVCPEYCRLDRFGEVSGESTHLFDDFKKYGVYTPFAWMGNYPNSLTAGYYGKMNERIARAMREYKVNKAAELFKFLKEDTVLLEYHKQWLEKNQNLPD